MPNTIAQIVLRRSNNSDQTFDLVASPMTIGRSEGNEIIIADSEVSRRHARIIPQGSGFAIEDMGSTNGTFVNGRRITTLTPLTDGDTIYLGETIQLDYELSGQSTGIATPTLALDDQPTLYDPYLTPEPEPSAPTPPDAAPPPHDTTGVLGMPPELQTSNNRRLLLGCGCATLLLIGLCIALFFFLDSYQQGRLLYCGGLRPFWETILGPLGFAPICP